VTVPASRQFKGQRILVCSGTLISPRVFLTAGHCTDFLTKEDLPTYVSFDPTYKPGASEVIKATPYTHPGFCFPTPKENVASHQNILRFWALRTASSATT